MRMRSSNPVLSEGHFSHLARDLEQEQGGGAVQPATMTIAGTVNKAAMALVLCVITAVWVWFQYDPTNPGATMPWMWGGLIVGFILGLATAFIPRIAPFTTLPYAAAQGLALGGISAFVESQLVQQIGPEGQGIAIQAMACTLGVFAVMLTLYMTRIIRVGQKLRAGITAAVGGIMVFYLIAIVGSLFGWTGASQFLSFNNGGLLSIGISVVIVGIAAFSLLLDFDSIERGAAMGAPKVMEWYGAFGLMVTLVWLYLEILRLLSKLKSR
ncbi:MAG: Bax inhibitor-1/YccA family protein [Planctomycetota bacterium]